MSKIESWLRDSTEKLLDNDVVVINQTLMFNQIDLIEQAYLLITEFEKINPNVNILDLAAQQLLEPYAVESINFINKSIEDDAAIDLYQFNKSVA